MRDHDYARAREHGRTLRAAGLTLLVAPEPGGHEVNYAPAWAVLFLGTLRQEAKANGRGLVTKNVVAALHRDYRYGPPPPELLVRIDELRAFAVLRGWTYSRGLWSPRSL
jgi:hypothetical protein